MSVRGGGSHLNRWPLVSNMSHLAWESEKPASSILFPLADESGHTPL